MKKKIRKIIITILSLILILVIINFNLVRYGIGQLKGQLNIVWNSQPVAKVINDPATPDSTANKLRLINEIRKFAIDSLGLEDSENYTTFFDQGNRPLMFVVTGCLPYSLKAKEWWFPVVGHVSYKGFFDEGKAMKEAETIRDEGYETDIYSPSAWSTLGYFTDPILSNMLRRSEGRIAELIIHELTHATIYLESSVDFNENFATFIGEKGAEQFLISKYGLSSPQISYYRKVLYDENLYGRYMLQSAQKLDSLYNSFSVEMPVTEKAKKKYDCIAGIMLGINRLSFNFPERYRFDFSSGTLPNNTEFMSFLRYRKELGNFETLYTEKFNSNLRSMINAVVEDEEVLGFSPAAEQ